MIPYLVGTINIMLADLTLLTYKICFVIRLDYGSKVPLSDPPPPPQSYMPDYIVMYNKQYSRYVHKMHAGLTGGLENVSPQSQTATYVVNKYTKIFCVSYIFIHGNLLFWPPLLPIAPKGS